MFKYQALLFALFTPLYGGWALASEPLESSEFKAQVEHHFAIADDALEVVEIPHDAVLSIIRVNLRSTLLDQLEHAAGVSLQAKPSDQQAPLLVALLVLHYPNVAVALQRKQRLARDGYFTNSKVLIPFSSAVSGNKLLIVFTENAGSKKVTEFVRAFPNEFEN